MADYEMMRRYLDLVVAGDFQTAMEFVADDVTAHVSGHHAVSGDYHGKAAYTEALGRLMGMVDELVVEEHDLLVSDGHAVVLNRWAVRKGDETTHQNHVIVYHTEGDRITELWIVAEDQEAEAAFFS